MNLRANKYQMDMCNGSIMKKLLIFTIPLIFSSVLQLLFNAADIVIVGRFAGDIYMGAVGSTSSIINLLVNFFIGLSIGANILVARYLGAKEKEDLQQTVHTAMAISVISGIILAIIGFFLAPCILTLMNASKEMFEYSVTYLRIYFLGMPAMMVYNFGASILRASGDTKRPLYYLTTAGVVNVALNMIFVIGFDMNVAGVALATTISQCISACLIIRSLMKEESDIRLEIKKLRIHNDKFIKILRNGLPAGLQGILFSLSNVVIQSSINSFGNTVIKGNSAASNIENFVYVAMNSFYQGTISFVSQNVGARKYKRIGKIAITSLFSVIAVGILLGNCVVHFGENLLSIYTSNPEVIAAGLLRMKFICRFYCLCGMMDVMVGVLRGMGYSIIPMIVSLIGACGLRIIFLMTAFKLEQFHKIEMVYMTYIVSWSLTFIAHIVTYFIVRRKFIVK